MVHRFDITPCERLVDAAPDLPRSHVAQTVDTSGVKLRLCKVYHLPRRSRHTLLRFTFSRTRCPILESKKRLYIYMYILVVACAKVRKISFPPRYFRIHYQVWQHTYKLFASNSQIPISLAHNSFLSINF